MKFSSQQGNKRKYNSYIQEIEAIRPLWSCGPVSALTRSDSGINPRLKQLQKIRFQVF